MKVTICTLKQISHLGDVLPKCHLRSSPRSSDQYALCKDNLRFCSYLRSFNVEDPKEPGVDLQKEIPLDNVVSMETL